MHKIFAIGDIHGMHDELLDIMQQIENERETSDEKFTIVFLGDYVDRGPKSKEVVEFLMAGPQNRDTWICLKGNHEDLMVQGSHVWLSNGGVQTLLSYDMLDENHMLRDGWLPQNHLDWMNRLPFYHETENHLFVHAGFFPQTPLRNQIEEDCIWIRDRFFRNEKDFAGWKHIVHGHTPVHTTKNNVAEPELLSWRTNLDTGAFHTGVLTAAMFDRNQSLPIKILQTKPNKAM